MVSYLKDTKKYWQAREQARIALDSKRAKVSPMTKARVAEHLASDIRFLKTGYIIKKYKNTAWSKLMSFYGLKGTRTKPLDWDKVLLKLRIKK